MNRIVHPAFLLLILLLATLTVLPARAADAIRIEAPVGGYVNSGGETSRYTQDVLYPASSVNTPENPSVQALIKGRIDGAVKGKEPYTLIVNGVAMPLRVGDHGGFSRPYAFGRGSNSVEVRSPDRDQSKRVQFYDSNTFKTQARVRVVLSWDSDGTDLDLHVITPDGQHCFYGNPVISNGGALDVDVTTGYGPEIFSLPQPLKGTYHVYVNYYGSGEQREVITVAQVALLFNENTVDERQQVFRIPMRMPGDLTLVKSFVYP
jgi:uncharacterized protein YfaP (DUF2135 family)